MSALLLLAAVCLLYMVSTWLLHHLALRGLLLTRAFPQPAYFEGEEGEMIEVVRNDRPLFLPWLRVECRVSPHILIGRQDNLLVSADTHYSSLFTLMPYQQIRRRHRVRFLRRGVYNMGTASLTAGDLFGIHEARREQEMDVPVLVYPRLLGENELPAPLSRLMNETVSRRHLLADPFLIRGIRPYAPGDPVRDIHWPASARMNETQLRLHDHTAQCRLMVVLNFQRSAHEWSDRVMDYEEAEIEYVISMAATLCVQALRAGLSAGFAANMPLTGAETCTVVEPAAGSAAQEAVLSAFARLRLRRVLTFPTFLDSLEGYSGLDMILLSRYDDEKIQASMERLRRAGNQVSLHVVKGGDAQ
ncbi:MAG: DUF58 domain-containing protein [Clostridia bacterium]|nr:DUF58 domain-containing protein [Clostridia bacterium]